MADIYLRSVPSDANTADVRLYDPTAADSGGTVTGTLGVTLAVLLLAGTGAVGVSSAATSTLGPLTLVGTGTAGGAVAGEPGQYFGAYYYGPRPVGSYRLKGGFFWKVV